MFWENAAKKKKKKDQVQTHRDWRLWKRKKIYFTAHLLLYLQ